MMEFDAKIDESVLVKEKQANLRDGSSIMYDTTAFNLSMMYGLDTITVPENLTSNLIPWKSKSSYLEFEENAVMWSVNGDDDRSVAFAARLMELGVEVRVINKKTSLSGHDLPRGSVVVIKMDNPKLVTLEKIIKNVAIQLDISVVSIESGFGPEELPDWGGEHFELLEKPQIAILSHEGFNSYDVGVSWWSIDHHLGIRHSQINKSNINYTDLRRYNTIIIPSGSSLSESSRETLSNWIKQGGTLIAHNRSVRQFTDDEGIGNVKQLQYTFDESQDFNIDLQRELFSLSEDISIDKTLSNKVNTEISYPWESVENKLSSEELKSRDKWQSLFMPSGSIVSARSDQKHWLTYGTNETLPVLYSNYPILMTGGSSQAAIRIGEIIDSQDFEDTRYLNWSSIPSKTDINIRMSGLVWPEAAQRIANSAYLTRERLGLGQLILFSGEPNFRGSALGTNRLWLNAVVYGTGLGTVNNIYL